MSLMLRRFKLYAYLCRASGCCFITGLQTGNIEKAKVVWKSWYTAYFLLSAACFAGYEAGFLMQNFRKLSHIRRHFTRALYFSTHLVVVVKAVVNVTCMICGSSAILRFFRRAACYEKVTGFNWDCVYGCRQQKWRCARRLFVFVTYLVVYIIGVHFYLRRLTRDYNYATRITLQALSVVRCTQFLLYDSLHFFMLKSCCDVLVRYMRVQHGIFGSTGAMWTTRYEKMLLNRLESVRVNWCTIRDLKRALNDIWKWSIVATCASTVLTVCTACYTAFDKEFPRAEFLILTSYSIYTTVDLVDMASLSHAMAEEAVALKHEAEAASFSGLSEACVTQIRHLHASVSPGTFHLSGSDFFAVDLSLLLSMMGAVITHTVILLQTSEGIEGSAWEHGGATASKNTDKEKLIIERGTNIRRLKRCHI